MIQQITDAMKQAMKAGDKPRLSAIRMFRAALKDREIAIGHALTDEDVVAVGTRLVKQRKDAAVQYQKAEREDLAAGELFEVGVISQWLPQAMADTEVAQAVVAACGALSATSMRDMGKVMGVLQKQLAGRADMTRVSALVKEHLAG
ncbi:MAG: GatB/YqeY domain-containing protein [Mariprofundales bacterium]|nr:GatB/YqeY domain-containing protein [Mariprofundales bacterium]